MKEPWSQMKVPPPFELKTEGKESRCALGVLGREEPPVKGDVSPPCAEDKLPTIYLLYSFTRQLRLHLCCNRTRHEIRRRGMNI